MERTLPNLNHHRTSDVNNNNNLLSEYHDPFETSEVLKKCSICFDQKYDFYFTKCRDQFCKPCFNRYVEEITKSSWGISLLIIKCPVCMEEIRKEEWQLYVDQQFVKKFEIANQPFKPMIRACPECDNQVMAVQKFNGTQQEKEQFCKNLWQSLVILLGPGDIEFTDKFRFMVDSYLQDELKGCFPSVKPIHELVTNKLNSRFNVTDNQTHTTTPYSRPSSTSSKRKRRPRISPLRSLSSSSLSTSSSITSTPPTEILCTEISAQIISLERNPEIWRNLQFAHVKKYKKYECGRCMTRFCFGCGEKGGHIGKTCLEWMKNVVNEYQIFSGSIEEKLLTPITRSRSKFNIFEPPCEPLFDSNNSLKSITAQTNLKLLTFIVNNEEYTTTTEQMMNMSWKLKNCKNCPNCSIVIARDDGCNKVDCAMCGYRFCWICKNNWGVECGFYKCKSDVDGSLLPSPDSHESVSTDTKMVKSPVVTESGVPDVFKIGLTYSPI